MTNGELLLCIGISGMAVVLIVSVVVIAALCNSRKRLRQKIDSEYYDKRSD